MEVELANILRSHGLKVTPQRLSILRILYKGGHFSGEQIYNELKKSEPSISLSTVYNTLNSLTEAGILNAFEINGITWYEIKRDLHINVYCQDTNQIIDITNIDLKFLYEELEKMGIYTKTLNIVAIAECSKLLRENQRGTS
ncbi:Fur family transcriptional regulator [Sulfurisphaera ohwakuensis]|uniref:Fur family peroxide stress response transcriptional regulator n=1 Tax=Sulfurisphaera ohwakuensis TaxID=69656 RepID=A0A650CJ44_SULOH|nr:Fur family transcriptional regulator [Sulfurisphaera ohwakuensis]MBB5253433.1 Fur family peroxide stress response transcriptional regulator [Sulfurisphaera ohwakuensis]QGR17748.1 transcriptional repressor [Sulfurisphaera ohwakuensis]